MRKIILLIVGFLLASAAAYAQSAPGLSTVVSACGSATYVAGQNRPNLQTTTGNQCVAASVAPSGTQNVNITQVGGNAVTTTVPISGTVTTTPSGVQSVTGTGTAGSPAAGVVSIQGVASGTAIPISAASLPLPTGAATSANQPTNAAIGSTTSGQTGLLSLGAVTTAAPTYVTGQTNPLSIDTAGNQRVIFGSGATTIVTQATAANLNAAVVGNVASASADSGPPVKIGAKYNLTLPTFADGNRTDLQANSTGQLYVATGAATNSDAVSNYTRIPDASGTPRVLGVQPFLFNNTTSDRGRSIPGADGTGLGVAAMAVSPNSSAPSGISTTTPAGNTNAYNASGLIACSGACNVYKIEAVTLASSGYLMLFNATTAPADGAVTPDACMPIAATTGMTWVPGTADIPQREGTGAVVVFSTGANCRTKTAAAIDMIKVLAK